MQQPTQHQKRFVTCSGSNDEPSKFQHHYEERSGTSAQIPLNSTAFRRMERLYRYRSIKPRLASTVPISKGDLKKERRHICKLIESLKQEQSKEKSLRDESSGDDDEKENGGGEKENSGDDLMTPTFEELETAWKNVLDFRNLDWNPDIKELYVDQSYDLSPSSSSSSSSISDKKERIKISSSAKAFTIKGVPGFIFIRNALDHSEQKRLVTLSYTQFSSPPNQSNLDLLYNISEPGGIWHHHVKGTPITKRKNNLDDDEQELDEIEVDPNFLKKWRWTTIGRGYDWSSKSYKSSSSSSSSSSEIASIPEPLKSLCQDIVKALPSSALSNVKESEGYEPDAGIINFYGPKDTLTGHIDRSEPNASAPLVSISLGASAIFLLGGPTRDSSPIIPLVLRSGDVTIMSGPCRRFFHGVPRILENDLVPIQQWLNSDNDEHDDEHDDEKCERIDCWKCKICPVFYPNQSDLKRINLNVRQYHT